jgi:hypothetical protein
LSEINLNFDSEIPWSKTQEYKRLYFKHRKEGTLDSFLTRGKNTGRSKDYQYRLKSNLDWFRKNPASRLLSSAKTRAKKRGLEFNLELEDIVIPEYCPILGLKLKQGGFNSPNSPSLDRVDNSKGYIKGNVKVISHRANSIKRDATLEELQAICEYMKNE